MRNNQKHWSVKIDEQAVLITNELGNREIDCLAISSRQYAACNLSQKLGEVTEYHSLGDLADILHVPVPFLEEHHFYRRRDPDGLFEKLSKDQASNMKRQRNGFRDMFSQIIQNMMSLISDDIFENST